MPSAELPSSPSTRPFGMGFAVVPSVVQARHAKKPTQKSRQQQTEITDDGQVIGHRTDTVYYTEMDEE